VTYDIPGPLDNELIESLDSQSKHGSSVPWSEVANYQSHLRYIMENPRKQHVR